MSKQLKVAIVGTTLDIATSLHVSTLAVSDLDSGKELGRVTLDPETANALHRKGVYSEEELSEVLGDKLGELAEQEVEGTITGVVSEDGKVTELADMPETELRKLADDMGVAQEGKTTTEVAKAVAEEPVKAVVEPAKKA